MRVHGLKSPGNDESTARRRVDVRVPPCTVGHALHRRRSGKVAYGAHARSCPGLADCDGDRPGRRHRTTGTRQRISTWCGENGWIQVRLRNRPLNAAAVVDGYWLAGLPSDQMRTLHLVRRYANLNEGRRHGQPYRWSVDHSSGACWALRVTCEDACSVGIEGDGPSLCEVWATRPIPLEWRSWLGSTAIRRWETHVRLARG